MKIKNMVNQVLARIGLGRCFARQSFRGRAALNVLVGSLADIADALEPIERAAAKERQGERTDKHPGKFPESSNGNALDKIAKGVGKDRVLATYASCKTERKTTMAISD